MDIPTFSSLNYHLDFLCRQGVEKEIFPGVATAVATGYGSHRLQVVSTSGQTRLDKQGTEIGTTVFFDLASLTKPLATTLSVFYLLEQGFLDLDDRYIDISRRKTSIDKKEITIAHLLSHSSGLSSYKPYFELFRPYPTERTKEEILRCILREPLEYEIGAYCKYSDLGFILLGDLIEQVSGQALNIFFQERITKPLGLAEELFYLPQSATKRYIEDRFAATELCGWRNRVLQGEVHDEHCFLMGGVAGHAGLFGTVNGVIRLCIYILDAWQGRQNRLPVSGTILKKALQRLYPDRTWCLGFDTPSSGYTSAGKYISKRSVGHLGYTGTSFWIDPESDSIFILLTNRVHPSRKNNTIREFRPWFHDKVVEFLFPSMGKRK